MSRVSYVNGRYVSHRDATVHVEDRGYQFADGVYEVIAITPRGLLDEEPHLERLDRSLRELAIEAPMSRRALKTIIREVIRANRVLQGIVYIQVTRGQAPRDHPFPVGARPSLVLTARSMRPRSRSAAETGVAIITIPDIRWQRCDIKSISLLPNVLGKQQAREAGAYEAWLVDRDGFVTEGTSTNAWIVSGGGDLVTRSATNAILNGITRQAVLALAKENGLNFIERPFSVEEAKEAREAFLTSSTSNVLPVTSIDDAVLGDGRAGPLSLKLLELYSDYFPGRRA